jgi:hypothetical protein
MTIRNLYRVLSFVLPCTGAVAACSLTVPAEDELFGGGAGAGGTDTAKAGSNMGGSGTSGGGSSSGKAAGGADAGGPPSGGGEAAGEGGGAGSDSAESGGAGSGAGGEPGVVLPPADLLLHYTFDDLSALVAEDASGNDLHGTIAGDTLPSGAVGHVAGAIALNEAMALKQHVTLPDDILLNKAAVSITSWLKLSQAAAWDRLFDFNAGTLNFFYFSPTGWNPNTDPQRPGTRCALLTTSSGLAPELILEEIMGLNTWHHVAIVIAKPYLRYYLDGALKAELDTLTFGISALGSTNKNWIGRSAHAGDPYLSGLVDDFRIYTGALTAEEIAELAAQ